MEKPSISFPMVLVCVLKKAQFLEMLYFEYQNILGKNYRTK